MLQDFLDILSAKTRVLSNFLFKMILNLAQIKVIMVLFQFFACVAATHPRLSFQEMGW